MKRHVPATDTRIQTPETPLGKAEPALVWHKPVRLRLEELDGLRGILALHVVVYHLQAALPGVSGFLKANLPIVFQAWFAVDVFFVMSGFIMMYVYGPTFAEGVDWASYRKFFGARIARLYPVHLFALALLAAWVLPFVYASPEFLSPDGRYSWTSGIANLLMLHSPWIDHRTWNYPSWSISAEWHAYAVFPLVAVLAARWKTRAMLAAVVVGVLMPLAIYLLDPEPGDAFDPTNTPLVLLRVIPLFVAGMALYRLNQSFGRLASGRWAALSVVGSIVVLLSIQALAPLAVLLVPALVLCALNSPALRGALSSRLALFLGAISYSLYMTHALVGIIGLGLWTRRIAALLSIDPSANDAVAWLVLIAATGAAVLFGWLTFRFVEVPARRVLVKRLV